jgi:hypothetical protein
MSEIMKVENVKFTLKIGELYLVPCIVRKQNDVMYITPVINHPHNDKENGQEEFHYHVDYRFVKHQNDSNFPTVINKHSKHYFVEHIRPQEEIHGKLEYFILPVLNDFFTGITPIKFIENSKLKHKCIHKNKCPHRGYDLSQVPEINDIITCPLHGLRFCAKTKNIL